MRLFGPKGGVLVWIPGIKNIDPQCCPFCRGKFKNRMILDMHVVTGHPNLALAGLQLFALYEKAIPNAKS